MSKFNLYPSATSIAPDDTFLIFSQSLGAVRQIEKSTLDASTNVPTVALLKALTVSLLNDGDQILVGSYSTDGDGGGGTFVYDAGSSAVDDGGTIFQPTSGSGRFLRVFSGRVSVRWFGAKGTGLVNDTSACQAAIDYAKGITNGAQVYFPAGTYNVTSLNMSKATAVFVQTVALVGDGYRNTVIKGTSAGLIVVDCLGMNSGVISDLRITSDVGAQTGLLFARSTTSTNCKEWKVRNVVIDGSFTVAAHVAIAAEINQYNNCWFHNNNATNGYATFCTGNYNDFGIVSTNGTTYDSSNTQNVMHGCTFYAPFNSARVAKFQGVAGYVFFGCHFTDGAATGGRLINLLMHGTESVWSGPLEFHGCLFESAEADVVYLTGKTGATSTFKNLTLRDGYINIYTAGANDVIATNQSAPTLVGVTKSVIENARYNELAVATISGLYFVEDVTFDLRSNGTTGVITIDSGGYQATSILLAGTVAEAATSINYQGQSYGTAAPVAGTYAKGHIRWNTDATSLEFYGLMGWRCYASGTPGSWKPMYHGLLSGVTGSRPGGTKPAGLTYFDTTLGLPVFWDLAATAWVDATGTPA